MLRNIIYNTNPKVIHCPQCDLGDLFLEKFICDLHKSKLTACVPDDLAIISWDNKSHETVLKRSLGIFGIEATFLGSGIDWTSNELKIDLTNDFLKSNKKKYVLGLDSYDAILFGSPDKLLSDFRSMSSELVFNATLGSYPSIDKLTNFEQNLPSGRSVWRHLNAGVWIGVAEYCKYFFESLRSYKDESQQMAAQYVGSEQLLVRMALEKEYPFVDIDHQCKMFQVVRESECYPEELKINRGLEINGKKFKEAVWFL